MSLKEWRRLAPPIGCHLDSTKKGGKNLMFYWGKICLGLRANAPVSISRISLLPTGPVSKGSRNIYQNAQNEALSVV